MKNCKLLIGKGFIIIYKNVFCELIVLVLMRLLVMIICFYLEFKEDEINCELWFKMVENI